MAACLIAMDRCNSRRRYSFRQFRLAQPMAACLIATDCGHSRRRLRALSLFALSPSAANRGHPGVFFMASAARFRAARRWRSAAARTKKREKAEEVVRVEQDSRATQGQTQTAAKAGELARAWRSGAQKMEKAEKSSESSMTREERKAQAKADQKAGKMKPAGAPGHEISNEPVGAGLRRSERTPSGASLTCVQRLSICVRSDPGWRLPFALCVA